MPDLSKCRRYDDDFQPSHQLGGMPPDVPAPLSPLLELRNSSAIRRQPKPVLFTDPEQAERERKDRLARASVRDRIETERSLSQARLLGVARREGYAKGFDAGEQRGYHGGWYWGLAFGVMLGCGLTYFAMKVGFAIGA